MIRWSEKYEFSYEFDFEGTAEACGISVIVKALSTSI